VIDFTCQPAKHLSDAFNIRQVACWLLHLKLSLNSLAVADKYRITMVLVTAIDEAVVTALAAAAAAAAMLSSAGSTR
jgi:hypothetical protein